MSSRSPMGPIDIPPSATPRKPYALFNYADRVPFPKPSSLKRKLVLRRLLPETYPRRKRDYCGAINMLHIKPRATVRINARGLLFILKISRACLKSKQPVQSFEFFEGTNLCFHR